MPGHHTGTCWGASTLPNVHKVWYISYRWNNQKQYKSGMYNQQTNIVVCKHNEYTNLKNLKHNIEAFIQIQNHKAWWVGCQVDYSHDRVTKILLCTNSLTEARPMLSYSFCLLSFPSLCHVWNKEKVRREFVEPDMNLLKKSGPVPSYFQKMCSKIWSEFVKNCLS